MSKIAVSITIDSEIAEKCKELGINRSAVCESALRLRLNPTKSDMPEDVLKMECSECHGMFDNGFYCEEGEKFYCLKHHENCLIMKSRTNNLSPHLHIRVPGKNGQNMIIAKEISK